MRTVLKREALFGPSIFATNKLLDGHAVIVNDGLVEAVTRVSNLPLDIPARDLGPGILSPGLIDTHAHGAGGFSFNDALAKTNQIALNSMLRAGVTTVLPTISSAPVDDMIQALSALEDVRSGLPVPRTPGAHLEGPFFSMDQAGAQDLEALVEPTRDNLDRFLEFSDSIQMISYAPELNGALELTERLVANEIIAAAGHSNCTEDDLIACKERGLSHVIHIYSGQSTTSRSGPWRRPGLLEATLASEDLTVEMIADGKHLPQTLMKLAFRCLEGRLSIVSDSVAGTGLPNGSSYKMGGKDYVVGDGVGITLDGTAFAGSTTPLAEMLPVVRDSLGLGVPEILAMVTSIPARAARLRNVGEIAEGYHADFTLFDENLKVRDVCLEGIWTVT